MDILWQELSMGFGSYEEFLRSAFRLFASFLIGGIIGFQREWRGKPAGLKTHILVSLSATIMILTAQEVGVSFGDSSRIIQGIVTGIGFIGAGSIIKLDDDKKVKGLTTAASIWVTAALGIAVGFGKIGLALLSLAITIVVLAVVSKFEREIEERINHEFDE